MKALFSFLFIVSVFFAAAQADPQGKQTITSGTSITLADDVSLVDFNPPSLMASYALTLPASPSDRQMVAILFGGTMTSGNPLVTSFSLAPSPGQTITQMPTDPLVTSGDYLVYFWVASKGSWNKFTGLQASVLAKFVKKADVTQSINNAPARSINSGYKISTTQSTRVSYTVTISASVSVGQALAFLEISPDNSTWTTINAAGETSVSLLNTKYYNLQGEVPANYYCRIRSSVTAGGAVAFSYGQENTYYTNQ